MRGQWVEMCCDTLAWSIGAPTDFVADKTTRLLRILERICELFGSPYDRERGRSFAYLIEGQTRPIRLELDKVAESVGPNHPHFGKVTPFVFQCGLRRGRSLEGVLPGLHV